MNLRYFIFSLLIMLSSTVLQAQTSKYASFNLRCKLDPSNDELDWLRFLFKVESCIELSEKLSQVKSFNEFVPPLIKRTILPGSWVNEFPEIIGIQSKYDVSDVERILKREINTEVFFKNLYQYNEFKIKIAEYSGFTIKRDICSDLGQNYFKTLLVDWGTIGELEKCKLNNKYSGNTNIIILGDYIGSGKEAFAENIIGVEFLAGGTRSLEKYPSIRFVGLDVWSESSLSALVVNQNITHLSLNSDADLSPYISSLSELQNLAFLGLSCMKGSDMCEKPYLKNLNFLKDIPWLKSLNLSRSGLENVDEVVELTELERLDVSNNRIKTFPDFAKLQKLKYLNTENNPGQQK